MAHELGKSAADKQQFALATVPPDLTQASSIADGLGSGVGAGAGGVLVAVDAVSVPVAGVWAGDSEVVPVSGLFVIACGLLESLYIEYPNKITAAEIIITIIAVLVFAIFSKMLIFADDPLN